MITFSGKTGTASSNVSVSSKKVIRADSTVVGIIGTWQNFIMNVLLGVTMMGAAIGLLIGIPLVIGKIFLCLNYWWLVERVMMAPVRVVYKGLRPIVSIVVEIVRDVLVAPAAESLSAIERLILVHSPSSSGSIARSAQQVDRGWIQATTSYLVGLYAPLHGSAAQIASMQSTKDRILCLAAGYTVGLSVIGALVSAGEAKFSYTTILLAGWFSQWVQFAKLAFFMTLEMVMFPVVTGSAIFLSVLPVVPEATFGSVWGYSTTAPLAAAFFAWVIGTR
jgi:E3 ubiquitin-protein ligase MARCH6